jgi:isomerase DpgB
MVTTADIATTVDVAGPVVLTAGGTRLALPYATEWLVDGLDGMRSARPGTGLVVDFGTAATGTGAPASLDEWTRWGKAVRRLERLDQPTAAAVAGPIDGLAFDLMLCLDIVVAGPDATFRCADLHRAHLPDMVLFRLAKTIGLGHAKRLLFLNQSLTAAQALRLGLVTEISDQPGPTAAALLKRGPALDTAVWPLARRLLLESYAATFEDAHGSVLAAQDRILREAEAPS